MKLKLSDKKTGMIASIVAVIQKLKADSIL